MDYPQASQGQGCDMAVTTAQRYGAGCAFQTLSRSWIIMDNQGLCIIADYCGLSWIMDCRGLSLRIMDYHRLSWIMNYRR
jgi:hypothetical protein